MRNHIMIDLETVGQTSGSAIASIGAVAFSPYEDWSNEFPEDMDIFYKNIDIQSCFDMGLCAEGETLLWWMKQDNSVVEALTNPEPLPFVTVAKAFKNFYWDQKNKYPNDMIYVWSHGASFDPPMWQSACKAAKMKEPWLYRNCRDTRTLFDLAFDGKKPTFEGFGETHNALNDSLTQVIWVQEAYRALNKC